MKALVVHQLNQYAVEDVSLDKPKAGEVLVRMRAAGVCHSDLSIINGTIPHPFPTVIGHEGAGIVEQVGEGVANVQCGDHVLLSFIPQCGHCYFCEHQAPNFCLAANQSEPGKMLDGTTRLSMKGRPVSTLFMLGNMAEYAIVPSISLTAIDADVPFEIAALVGCGVTTGVGAALKTAPVCRGDRVAIFGCGGVGLSVIQGARIAGAKQIFAVDLSQEKLDLANEFGATDLIHAKANSVKEIMDHTDNIGVDKSFEVVGHPDLVQQALAATRRGGTVTLVGIGRFDQTISLNALMMPASGKIIKGCLYGDADFKTDFPHYLKLYQQNQLELDRLITKTYPIAEAVQAIHDLEQGKNARGVITF